MGYLALKKQKKRDDILFTTIILVVSAVSFLGFSQTTGLSIILNQYRLQYALITALVFIVTPFKGRLFAAFLALCLTVLNLAVIASHVPLFAEKSKEKTVEEFSIYLHRVGQNNFAFDGVLDGIKEANPEIAILLDVPEMMGKEFKRLEVIFPYRVSASCGKDLTCEILSKDLNENSGNIEFKSGGAVYASFKKQERKFTVVGISEGDANQNNRNEENIEKLIDFAKSRDEAVILTGGFVSVPWDKRLLKLESEAGFIPQGALLAGYPASLPLPLRLSLDNFYAHPGIRFSSVKLKNNHGSKYMAIGATVELYDSEPEVKPEPEPVSEIEVKETSDFEKDSKVESEAPAK